MKKEEVKKLNRKSPKLIPQIQKLRSRIRRIKSGEIDVLDAKTAELICVQLASYFTEDEKDLAKKFFKDDSSNEDVNEQEIYGDEENEEAEEDDDEGVETDQV